MTSPTETKSSNSPSHYVYTVRDRKDQKGIWTRVGAAWPMKDGKGFKVQLDAIPLDGHLALYLPSEIKK